MINTHKHLWTDKVFVISVIVAVIFLALSLYANYLAMGYAAKEVGNATTDLLLANLPVVNTNVVFSEGVFLFIVFMGGLFLLRPNTIPFTLKSAALFILVRAAFVTMTHLAPDPQHIMTDLDTLRYMKSAGADLFFSGHTGMPFLIALIFWKDKYLGILFLACSIIAAAAVILGHLHYTIDVFSAFFISYGVYHIALKFFKKDRELFYRGENSTVHT